MIMFKVLTRMSWNTHSFQSNKSLYISSGRIQFVHWSWNISIYFCGSKLDSFLPPPDPVTVHCSFSLPNQLSEGLCCKSDYWSDTS